MALPTPSLVGGGLHHMVADGIIDVGAGLGQVPALGNNQLLRLDLSALPRHVRHAPDFGDQLYIDFLCRDNNLTLLGEDAQLFELDARGDPEIVRLRVDIAANSSVFATLIAQHTDSA